MCGWVGRVSSHGGNRTATIKSTMVEIGEIGLSRRIQRLCCKAPDFMEEGDLRRKILALSPCRLVRDPLLWKKRIRSKVSGVQITWGGLFCNLAAVATNLFCLHITNPVANETSKTLPLFIFGTAESQAKQHRIVAHSLRLEYATPRRKHRALVQGPLSKPSTGPNTNRRPVLVATVLF